MNRILELKQQRAALYDKASAILQKQETEKRELTPEELAEVEGTPAAMAAIQRSIDAIQNLEAARPDAADLTPNARREPGQVHNRGEDKPWGGFGEFLFAVRHVAISNGRTVDPRLLATRAASGMNEAVPSEGGFLVGTDFSSEIFKRMYEIGAIVSRCRTVPISANSNGLKMKGIDETSRANGSRWGGVRSYWADEATSVTATKPKFREISMTLNKLFATYYVTDEQLQDAVATEALCQEAFSDEMSFKVEDAVIRGTGSGQPDGILNAGCLVSVAKETSQPAATLLSMNVFKMWARMWGRSRPNAVWLVNQDIEPQMYGMTIPVKNVAGTENVGGSAVYLPAGGINNAPYATLMGRPVIPVEYSSTVGTQGDIMLADLSQYMLINKGGVQAAQSMHVNFLTDEMCFRLTYRVDGEPLWNSALTPYKGSNTLSPFVVLDTRA